MNNYLKDTEFCTKELFDLIFKEKKMLELIKENEKTSKLKILHLNKEFDFQQNSDDGNDIKLQSVFCEREKERLKYNKLKKEIEILEYSISNKNFSLQMLAGSVFQIAKQGISIVHGNLKTCPNGRFIGKETLKNIIWQARNQSIHFEEGNFHNSVTSCFENLKNIDSRLNLVNNENKSLYILELLEWNNYEKYKDDMLTLS